MKTYKILPILLLLLAICAVSLSAQERLSVFLDDKELENVQAQRIDGHVMLPAEEVFKVLDVEFNKNERTGNWNVKTKSSRAMLFHMNYSFIRFNTDMFTPNGPKDLSKDLSCPPKYVDNKLFIPFEAICDEVFDCVATFDEAKKRVLITSTVKTAKEKEKGSDFELKLGGKYDGIFKIPDSRSFLAARQKYNRLIERWVVTLTKFDENGHVIWHKDLSNYRPSVPLDLEPGIDIVTFADGKFIAAIGSKIIKFDAECNVEWVCDMTYAVERKLFVEKSNDIIVLEGTVQTSKSSDGTAYYRQNDKSLALTKLDDTGRVVMKKVLGGQGKGDITLKKATYDEEAGLVIMCSTSFLDGDFIMAKSNRYSSDFVAAIDPNSFEVNFIFGHVAKYETIYSDMTCRDFLVINGLIHIVFARQSHEIGVPIITFVSQATKEGREILRVELPGYWYLPELTALADGNFMAYYDNDTRVRVSILNQQGDILAEAEMDYVTGLPRRKVRLVSTDDGGCISLQILEGRNIPTNLCYTDPPKDSETVATKYDKNFNVVWQKKYNLHTDVSVAEMVFPISENSGLLIVE